jgi:hypothetical protein
VVQQNLSEELREDLGVFSRQIEVSDNACSPFESAVNCSFVSRTQSLSLMIDDQSGERARKELKGVVQKFTDELHE